MSSVFVFCVLLNFSIDPPGICSVCSPMGDESNRGQNEARGLYLTESFKRSCSLDQSTGHLPVASNLEKKESISLNVFVPFFFFFTLNIFDHVEDSGRAQNICLISRERLQKSVFVRSGLQNSHDPEPVRGTDFCSGKHETVAWTFSSNTDHWKWYHQMVNGNFLWRAEYSFTSA